MRIGVVIVLTAALAGCVSPAERREAAVLPPANVPGGAAPSAPAVVPPSGQAGKAILYNGSGGYVLPDGTTVTGDGTGGFTLPNGSYVKADGTGGIVLPNGTRCVSNGARGYLCP